MVVAGGRQEGGRDDFPGPLSHNFPAAGQGHVDAVERDGPVPSATPAAACRGSRFASKYSDHGKNPISDTLVTSSVDAVRA